MRIALDAMGGDDAPRLPVAGAVQAAIEDRTSVLLVGDETALQRELEVCDPSGSSRDRIEIVHAEEVVGMDESPIAPLRKKRRSSIRICAELVKQGEAQAMVSAGNTGATMACAKMVIGLAPGADRPALAAALPNSKGWTIVVDVGANVDSKASLMQDFAVMGHFYAQELIGIENPRLGLLSIGSEEGKGTDFTREAFEAVEATGLNFVGNVEGQDIFSGAVDVVVCDGFVGNVVLKSSEALAEMITGMLRDEIRRRFTYMLGYLLIRPGLGRLRRRTDYSEYGGAPLLGLRGGCFIAHGRSSPKAIKNAVRRAVEFCENGIHEKIGRKLAELHDVETARATPPPEVTTS